MTEKLTSEERGALRTATGHMSSACETWECVTCAALDAAVEAILTAHVAAAVAEAREMVAREIEARRVHIHDQAETDCVDGCGWLDFAARIARGTS